MPLSIKRRLTLAASVSLLFFLGGELPSSAQQAASFTYDQRGRLTVFVAPDGTITKYIYDAAGNISSIQRGTAADLMRIDSVTPNTGVVPGNTLTIVGQNFDPVASNNAVLFTGVSGSVPALVTSASATQLTVQVPQGAVTGAIRVQRLGQTATGPVVTIQTLTVTSISPTTPVVSGSTITLTGQGFSLNANGNTVSFLGAGGTSIPVTVTTTDPTQLSVQVPAGSVSGLISVTSGVQTVPGPNVQIQTLTISGVSPAGPYLPGATITLSGTGFSLLPGGNTVNFAGSNGTTIPVTATTSDPAQLSVQIPLGVVNGAVSVNVAPQTATGPFIQIQSLQITSVSPTTPVVSGDTITINGQGFSNTLSNNVVRFTGANGAIISATPTTASLTQLTVDVPAGVVSGQISVSVPPQTATGPVLQIVPLQITSQSPTTPVSAGDTITINGQGFSKILSNNIVNFTGANGTIVAATSTSTSSTQITVRVPLGTVSGPISISVPPQVANGSDIQIQPIQITSISPTTPVNARDEITIFGQGFSTVLANNTVIFTGRNGATVSAIPLTATKTQLYMAVPPEVISGPISVSVLPQTATGPVLQIVPLQITSIYPPGLVASGSFITISGKSFSEIASNDIVNFTGANGTTVSVTPLNSSTTQLSVLVPTDATSGPISLTVSPQTAPGPDLRILRILSVSPNTPIVSGEFLTVTGENFSTIGTVVSIGNSTSLVRTTNPNQLSFQVPVEATSGPLIVSIDSAKAIGPLISIPVPAITSISPSSPVVTGTILNITGSGFSLLGANSFSFPSQNGSLFAAATLIDATHLSVQVPKNVISGLISVTAGYQSSQGPNLQITPLRIDSISPNTGVPVNSVVTITGQGFPEGLYLQNSGAPNVSVMFQGANGNQIAATNIIQSNPTQITVQLPQGAVSGPVTVSTGAQSASYPNINISTVQVSAVTPSANLVPKQIVTIEGQNFNPTSSLSNKVYFPLNNGQTVANVLSATATQLTVEVPIDFSTGTIQVATNGVTVTGPNITPVPLVVSSVSPNVGVAPGQTVLITGQGFNPYQADGSLSPQAQVPQRILVASTDLKIAIGFQPPPAISLTKVFFSDCQGGLVEGTVQAATSTQLRVLVPNGTCSGSVTVQALGQTATGPAITSQSSSNSVHIVEVPMPAKMVSFSESVEGASK
jgi:YD repeat-containing protein